MKGKAHWLDPLAVGYCVTIGQSQPLLIILSIQEKPKDYYDNATIAQCRVVCRSNCKAGGAKVEQTTGKEAAKVCCQDPWLEKYILQRHPAICPDALAFDAAAL